MPHPAHGAIEDGLNVWAGRMSKALLRSRNFSSKAATSAGFLKKMLVLIVFDDYKKYSDITDNIQLQTNKKASN